MKSALIPIAALLLSGCVSTMPTHDALMANPAETANLTTAAPYESAYRTTLARMTLCFSTSTISVVGDKTNDDAIISTGINLMTQGIASTIKLVPAQEGTRITIYSAGTMKADMLKKRLDYWLNRNGTECAPS
jgi:uncharacterized protein YceK